MTRDVDRLLIGSNNFETCWPRVDCEKRAGAEWGCERLITWDSCLCETGNITGKQSRACDSTDEFHKDTYEDSTTIVPEAQTSGCNRSWMHLSQPFNTCGLKLRLPPAPDEDRTEHDLACRLILKPAGPSSVLKASPRPA
jgi:hypothetical protein